MGTATAVATRGDHIETEHAASIAVADAAGHLVASAGDPRRATPLRSTAKPFQALALGLTGAVDRYAVTSEELALACASHQGTARHVALAEGLLARLGLDPGALRCGAHAPGDAAAARVLTASGQDPRSVHNNCSGKHAGMLAAALACVGGDVGAARLDGYLERDHPVQRIIREVHAELSGSPHLAWVTDGCSAPSAVMPLSRLARMAAALADPGSAPERLRGGLEAAFAAMRAHPELVAGEGVLDTTLMRAIPGLVAKRGADGAYLLALRESPRGPLGVALKVHDGSADARGALVLATLDALGVDAARLAALAPLRDPRRVNWRGLVVGRWEATVALD